jgi:hypothetical protein
VNAPLLYRRGVLSAAAVGIAGITPTWGAGMVKRNPSYSGPACRVKHVIAGTETDVSFDSNGYVTANPPYGAATRVITIYDQWGSDNLVCAGTGAGNLVNVYSHWKTWSVTCVGGVNSGFYSTNQASAATTGWAQTNPVVAASIMIRTITDRASFIVPKSTGVASWLHEQLTGGWNLGARMGASSYSWKWGGANASGKLTPLTHGQPLRLIMAGYGGNSRFVFNGVSDGTSTYTNPVAYDSTTKLCIAQNSTTPNATSASIDFVEILVYSCDTALLTDASRDSLDTVLFNALRPVTVDTYTWLNLLANSSAECWFDIEDTSKMWSDTARTTPIAGTMNTAGELVGAWDDSSGNGHHAVAPLSTQRPTYFMFTDPRNNITKRWMVWGDGSTGGRMRIGAAGGVNPANASMLIEMLGVGPFNNFDLFGIPHADAAHTSPFLRLGIFSYAFASAQYG